MPLTVDDLVRRFAPWRARHARKAWHPQLGAAEGRSRFGGAPDMVQDEPWPSCSSCGAPMLFLLQLDLAVLPVRPKSEGLLQLFYCSEDQGTCETWAAFSGANLVRVVDGALVRRLPPGGIELQPERAIVGWQELDDYPESQEHEDLGLTYDYDFAKRTVRITCPEIDFDERDLDLDECTAEAIATAEGGDKLFGWPHWVQGREYPTCPECKRRMEHVFQVDSEHGVALMFGDLGIGHITQCPLHPHVVAFAWACG